MRPVNRLHATEAAIVATLTQMGPLAFVPLVKLVQDERQLVGYGLSRLRAQGKVAIHEHRMVENASGENKLIPIYCALRPPCVEPGALAISAAEDADQSADAPDPNAACPTCGWKRIGMGATG